MTTPTVEMAVCARCHHEFTDHSVGKCWHYDIVPETGRTYDSAVKPCECPGYEHPAEDAHG